MIRQTAVTASRADDDGCAGCFGGIREMRGDGGTVVVRGSERPWRALGPERDRVPGLRVGDGSDESHQEDQCNLVHNAVGVVQTRTIRAGFKVEFTRSEGFETAD